MNPAKLQHSEDELFPVHVEDFILTYTYMKAHQRERALEIFDNLNISEV